MQLLRLSVDDFLHYLLTCLVTFRLFYRCAHHSVFDASIDRYNVYKVETMYFCPQHALSIRYRKLFQAMYKVETIGDAYMVASGLPTVYERHAQEMSLLALELLESVKDHVIEHLPERKTQLRIGLHTGRRYFGLKCAYASLPIRRPFTYYIPFFSRSAFIHSFILQ